MLYTIPVCGNHLNETFFVPWGCVLVGTGVTNLTGCKIVIENYYERNHACEKFIDFSGAYGQMKDCMVIAAPGDLERWQRSPLNPARKFGGYSQQLEQLCKWSPN